MPSLWKGESDEQIAEALRTHHPTLRLVREAGLRIIHGTFNVEHDGVHLGGFQIEVRLDDRDVLALPQVREVGGSIPRVPDRHVNPGDGSACLYLPEELALRRRERFGITEFLQGPVRAFFLGQVGFELGKPFPFGELPHGDDGFRQVLAEQLGVTEITVCFAFLDMLSRKVIKAHWACPCGSWCPLRDCHHGVVSRLRRKLPLSTRRFLRDRARQTFPNPL